MPTADGQYHFDEFIGEVIGIAHLRRMYLDLPKRNGEPVTLSVWFGTPGADGLTEFISRDEITVGRALTDVRRQIREQWGR